MKRICAIWFLENKGNLRKGMDVWLWFSNLSKKNSKKQYLKEINALKLFWRSKWIKKERIAWNFIQECDEKWCSKNNFNKFLWLLDDVQKKEKEGMRNSFVLFVAFYGR